MHISLPRRCRRKLLLPPGLLALAGLLWLGCVMLSAYPEQLRQHRVMLLLMVPLDLSRPAYRGYETLWPTALSSPAKIAAFRSWHDVRFGDNYQINRRQRAYLAAAVRAISFDTTHDGGVRVYFTPKARYEDLIFTLDLMNRENIKWHWLDIKHGPATFYAITHAYVPPDSLECEGVGIPTLILEKPASISLLSQISEWLAELWQLTWLKPLAQPEWRPSMYLFAAIALLSSWRMVRNRRNTAFS